MQQPSSETKSGAKHPAFQLRLREGFTLPDGVLRYLADASVDALAGQGTKYSNACRNLSELTRLVGEVLHRARARSQKAAQPISSKTSAAGCSRTRRRP